MMPLFFDGYYPVRKNSEKNYKLKKIRYRLEILNSNGSFVAPHQKKTKKTKKI